MVKNLFNKSKFNMGFTLAEVLITLVIVGIVAAMTIPTLVNNTQKQELVAGLKKAHSVLSQSLYKIGQNNGYPVGDYSFLSDVNFMNEFVKVTNVTKKCNSISECFGSDYNTKYKLLSGNTPSGLGFDSVGKSVITGDGFIYLYYYFPVPGTAAHGISSEDAQDVIGYIAVDVNGGKGPNVWGRDVFLFDLSTSKGIIICGTGSESTCTASGSGYGCTAKVLRENAINY